MNCYPTGELGLGQLLKRSLRMHYLSLKYSIFCILLITFVKYLGTTLPFLLNNPYIEWPLYLLSGVAILFLFSAALLATHRAFIDDPKPIGDAIRTIWARKLQIYAVLGAYFAGIVVLHYIVVAIIAIEDHFFASIAIHGFTLMLLTAILLTFIAMFFFAPSFVVIEEGTFLKVARSSLILGEKNKFGTLVLFLFLFAMVLLLAPNSMHEYYLSTYHLDPLYDFVVLCVLLPLYINFTLFLINDSKQQVPVEEL